jgi:hypothetical protein
MSTVLKSIPMLIVTALILLLWVGGDLFFFIMAFFLIFIIPIVLACVIASIIFMIKSRKLATTGQNVLFFWGIFNILLFIAYCVFELPKHRCNPDIMAEHYMKYAKEMEELVAYTDRALEDSAYITLEFERGKPSIFHVQAKKDSLVSSNWEEDATGRQDSLMRVVGLTKEEFEKIHERLDDMGCIGIRMTQGKKWAEIWFRRVGMGMYSYKLANVPMSQEEKKDCLDNEEYIPYSDRVVFEYGGGAIGSQSFPAKQKEEFLRKHKPW